MAKIATDLEQSNRLAKILPKESADMYWFHALNLEWCLYVGKARIEEGEIPAWSLSALINILPDTIEDDINTLFGLNIKKNYVEYYNPSMGALYATYHSVNADDLVDACYELILKLNELNLL